jgi:HD-like signal output (HDOD) protein
VTSSAPSHQHVDSSVLEDRVRHIVGSNDFPALSREIIDTISAIDDSASSLQRLANVVLREYSLTLSVVRTANSVHYRRGARPIQSATHAMMMLGARTVRHLASSLLLFENFQRKSPSLRDLMILSLLSANHAREIAVRSNGGDPEEAHLCGMFRNLGEVLAACHFPGEYAELRALVQHRGMSESAASQAVLGVTYEQLGAEICRHWGMPDSVVQSIRSVSTAPLSTMDAITQFSHALTTIIYRWDDPAAATLRSAAPGKTTAATALEDLLDRYTPMLRLTRAQVQEVVERALDETRELFVGANISVDAGHLRDLGNMARHAFGMSMLGSGEWAATESTTAPVPAQLRTRLRDELEGRLDPSKPIDVGEVLLVALETLLRGGPFDRVVACVLNADRSRLVPRSALGNDAEELMSRLDMEMSPRGGPVPAILQQRQLQYLPVDRAMTAAETRWAHVHSVTQFGIVPLIVTNKIVGCLYLDRTGSALPDRSALQFSRDIGALVVRAIDSRRRSTASSISATPAPAASESPAATVAMTPESKSALVLRVLRGETVEQVARTAGIATSVIEQWRLDFLAGAHERLAAG